MYILAHPGSSRWVRRPTCRSGNGASDLPVVWCGVWAAHTGRSGSPCSWLVVVGVPRKHAGSPQFGADPTTAWLLLACWPCLLALLMLRCCVAATAPHPSTMHVLCLRPSVPFALPPSICMSVSHSPTFIVHSHLTKHSPSAHPRCCYRRRRKTRRHGSACALFLIKQKQ